MKSLNIEHVLPSFGRIPEDPLNGPRSGIVQAALMFARRFAAMHHQVGLTGWSEGRPRKHSSPEGVRIRTHPGYQVGQIAQWDFRWIGPMAMRSYTTTQPDILHVHVDPKLLRLRGKAKVLHLHTPVPYASELAYQKQLLRADAVVCCSQFLRDRFLGGSGWPADRTFVVHNGADIDRFCFAESEERAAARAKFGVDQDAFVIVYAGAVVPEKGLHHLIHAFARLKSRVENAELLVAGGSNLWGGMGTESDARAKYEQNVRNESPTGTHILGKLPHSQIPELFRAADILVVPSVWDEPFPLVALDGLAAGLPQIASNTGGLPEIVEDGRTGILIPPGDEAALEQAIYTLASDPALRARLSQASRERAQQFSWDRMAQQLERVYERVLDTKPATVSR
jgi:glycosyltransferase involved in cell wall biosynthesis